MKRHYIGQESVPVTHIFTADEMEQFALEMASQLGEAQTLEAEKKTTMNRFKEKIDEAQGRANIAAYKHRAGKETRYLMCHRVGDYKTGEILWLNPDTGEIVQRRKMTEEEKQVPLLPRDEVVHAAVLHEAEMATESAQ